MTDYDIPSPPEWTKPGSYIQTTVRHELIENRRKNDIVLIPVGSTENHGMHTVSAMDTLFVTGICEGVRRFTAKRGAPVSITTPPWSYGCHPYHHIGMPGTIIIRENVAREFLIDETLAAFSPGTVPPTEAVTLRSEAEMAPYLKEPLSDGWKSVYALPQVGPF